MPRASCLIVAALLFGACGDEKKPPPPVVPDPVKPAARNEPPAQAAAPNPADSFREKKLRELRAKLPALQDTVREREGAVADLARRHEKEAAEAETEDFASLRRRYVTLTRDARRQKTKLDSLTSRLAELEKSVAGSAKGRLKELRDKRTALEREYEQAVSFHREQEQGAAIGVVEESPVKQDLDTLRAMKHKWFEVTADARRDRPAAGMARSVSDRFRSWLGQVPRRMSVVKQVLGQPDAPKGKSPQGYDFTDLEFYILMEILENELDKRNIAVEKRELSDLGKKVKRIEGKLDALDQELAQLRNEQGGDLAEYEELKDREKTVKSVYTHLAAQVTEYGAIVGEVQQTRERHAEEMIAEEKRLQQAQAALEEVRSAIAKLEKAETGS
jgi:predicted  nucleic acid-binding Zn-ribbon protein